MKYDTSWWGVWLIPENARERSLLVQVHALIKDQTASYGGNEPDTPHFETKGEHDDLDESPPVGALVLPR